VLVLAAVITTLLQALANGTLPAPTAVIGAVVLAVAVATVGVVTARRPEAATGRSPARASA
jgi:hypothetical protein